MTSLCTFQIFLKVAEETGVDADPDGGEGEPPEDRGKTQVDTGKLKPFLFAEIHHYMKQQPERS